MIQTPLEDFQDTMGNQLLIINLKYKRCLDRNEFPFEELEHMLECSGKVFLAIHKYMGEAVKNVHVRS